jgi:hypothetical protein
MAEFKSAFIVNKIRLWMPNIQYALLLYPDHMVFVRIGGQFTSDQQRYVDKDFVKKERESKIQPLSKSSDEQLLKQNKANFVVLYSDILRVSMKEHPMNIGGGLRTGHLTIEQNERKRKFDIAAYQDFQVCYAQVREVLPDKLSSQAW